MQHQHMSPSEAVQVSIDLQSTFALGVHWATFMMSDEHYMDPKYEFEKALKSQMAAGCFTLNIGESRVLKL
jgi:N-acyl-phosphatidylethanolamine-hydrolysing phospholipase D